MNNKIKPLKKGEIIVKKLNDQELKQINAGYADRYFQNETLMNKNKKKNEAKKETKNTNIETTVFEDGSVCVSGEW